MEMKEEKKEDPMYRTYGKRWLVLLVVIFLNMSGAMVWLTFVAVAYRATSFYETSLLVINWLALIFNLTGVFVGGIATWVLEKYGLKVSLLLCAWLSCIGSCIRIASTIPSLHSDEKLIILFVGQILVALGQPFCIYSPAKTAATWFPENQRAIATTLGAIANPIGVVIAGVTAPFFVDSETNELDALNLLITMAVPATFAALLASVVMTTKAPPIPPSAGALDNREYFGTGLKEVLKNKNFMVLVIAIGGALGLYTAFATLLEQILCPYGYTDVLAGTCAAVMTAAGVVGAFIIGIIVDRTKQFSSAVKICYVVTTIGLITFCVLFHTYIGNYILILVGFIGIFSFGIYPVGVELGVETTFPVGVATSSGLIMMSGQIQSILLVSVLQQVGRVMSVEETILYNSKCYHHDETVTTTPSFNEFMKGTEATPLEKTYDLSVSVYVCGGYMVLLAITLLVFFRPQYKRMAVEREDHSHTSVEKSESFSQDINYNKTDLSKPCEFESNI